MGAGTWAKAKGRGEKHVTVVHEGGKATVTVHDTKKAAKQHGTALRAAGKDAYVHSAANYQKFIDPKWSEDQHPRDEQGRFS